MSKITAFDSKEYVRSNQIGEVKFYTPLGCGVTLSKEEEFRSVYIVKLQELAAKFGIEQVCGAFSSSEYFQKIGPPKAYRMSDELVKSVQEFIESVYFSYVILPSKDVPSVEVGGYRSPKTTINTFDFLRKVSNYFSYITAWNYIGIEARTNEKILIDDFHGKMTPAWNDITSKISPVVYSHGDECNPYISIADVIAFLTDKKLWDNHLRLTPENIAEVWKSYPFKVDVHFLDRTILSKLKWYSNDHIDLSSYYGRPIIFLVADGYNMEDVKKLSVYPEATVYARKKNGCIRGFDKHLDSSKVKDGDVIIYAGEESKKLALTLQDMYELTVFPLREIKEKV